MYKNIRSYHIRYTDVDLYDNIKLSTLLSVMEESACLSADELGFGYDKIMPRGIGFIIVNWYIELFRPITLFDCDIIIHTWPHKPSRTIFLRDFEIYVGEEKVGVASSRWCMIDLKNYSILPTSAFPPAQNTMYNDEKSVSFPDWKISTFEGIKAAEKLVTYSDYDHYNHVNNTKYADFCMDTFTPEELKGKFISRVSVNYVKQCKLGEKLEFYRAEKDGSIFIEGKVADESRVRFKLQLSDFKL